MRKLIVNTLTVAALAAALLPSHATAQPVAGSDAERVRLLAAGCTGCHGTNGYASAGGNVLAGIDRAYFIAQMNAFKSGTRPATVMHQLAKGYGDAEIAAMASYFASQGRRGAGS